MKARFSPGLAEPFPPMRDEGRVSGVRADRAAAELSCRAADPFAYWPEARSRIAGLGGQKSAPYPQYAFHTGYAVACRRARFVGRFDDLDATHGTLQLSILAQREIGAKVTQVAIHRIDLADLAAAGGGWRIDFPARDRRFYAMVGELLGASDASARGLTAELWDVGGDRRLGRRLRHRLVRARRRWLARSGPLRRRLSAVHRAGLVSHDPVQFEKPVSQMCTAAQIDSPAYAAWLDRVGEAKAYHRKRWEFIYILEALHSRGAIRPGARGLGFGCGRETLPALLAVRGCEILATDLPGDRQASDGWITSNQHSDSRDQLPRHPACPPDVFERKVGFRAVDMNAIPADLRGFDFCWSACAYEHLGSIEAGLAFVRNSLACLKPGGIAVHTSELNLSSNRDTIDHDSTVLFRRRDMERLALRLHGEGHEVAPLNFDSGDDGLDLVVDVPPYVGDDHLRLALRQFVTTSFGIIIRRK